MEKTRKASVDLIHKLHGSCGYSGVPRMKNLCQLIEQQLRSGTKEEDLEPELLELLDEMDKCRARSQQNSRVMDVLSSSNRLFMTLVSDW